VSLSIPFTVGKLIDYFTSPNPVGWSLCHCSVLRLVRAIMRLSLGFAASITFDMRIHDLSPHESFRPTDHSARPFTDPSHCGSSPCFYHWWSLQCWACVPHAYVR
jgi:hypothetical protein